MTHRERYDDRRRRGRCVDCGAKAEHRRARCRKHVRLRAMWDRSYQASNIERITLIREHKIWSLKLSNPNGIDSVSHERYELKVSNGMCVECPRVAEGGKRYCTRCHRRRLIVWRRYARKRRRAARTAVRDYLPLDTIVNLTRVRILRAACGLEWFSTFEINREMGASNLRVRNTVTKMLERLTKCGALDRRIATGGEGMRAAGGKYEFNITAAGRAEIDAVLGGRRRPSMAGKRASWAA